MRLTPKEPDINIGVDGFAEHDQLGRKDTGDKLSRLVENLESPTVIALDGSWGSGKSFFLKCWCGEHMKKENGNKAEVIYFDAFEHDFLDDPLIALTMAISKELEPDSLREKVWSKAKEAVPMLSRLVVRTGVGVMTGGLVQNADQMAEGVIKAVTKVAAGVVSDEANSLINSSSFWEEEQGKLAAMKAFKEALQSLVTVSEEDEPAKPLVIIIDELDRCRPDYALSMLEVMKHFFAVDGVHFVLGVNLKELENSVKARYGQGIKAGQYLQKFVHVKMPIEKPRTDFGDPSDYSLYFNSVVAELGIGKHNLYVHHVKSLLAMINYHNKLSLRDVERIATLCAVTGAISGVDEFEAILMAGLIIFSICEPDFVDAARAGKLEYSDIEPFFKMEGRESPTGYFDKVSAIWKAALSKKGAGYNFTVKEEVEFRNVPNARNVLECLPNLIADYLDAFRLP